MTALPSRPKAVVAGVLVVLGLWAGGACGSDDEPEDAAAPSASTTSARPTVADAGPDPCPAFERLRVLDDEVQGQINDQLGRLGSIDPRSPDASAQVDALLARLKEIVAGIDRQAIAEIYGDLEQRVPAASKEDVRALHTGTVALLDILSRLRRENLNSFESELRDPVVQRAGTATLALDRLSRQRCNIVLAD